MKKGMVKECRNKGSYFELQLIVGNKTQNHRIGISSADAQLLRKNTVCEFEENRGTLTKLCVNGKEIALKKPDKNDQSRKNTVGDQKITKKTEKEDSSKSAKAPYNFVPINKNVVKAKNQNRGVEGIESYPEIPSFDRYHEGLNTGYIDLNIKALTPLYIRDAYTQDEENKASEAKKRGEKWENPDFFSPGGTPKIPGSSLRGMVRNLLEIASCSQMKHVEDKRFYYRKVAVRGRYQSLMIERNRNRNDGLRPATQAGWLRKENGKHYIYPLEEQQIYRIDAKASGDFWEVVLKDEGDKKYSEKLAKFAFYPVSFIPAKEGVHSHRGGKIKLSYAFIESNRLVMSHEKAELDSNYKKGYLILSGSMGRNKHLHPLIHCPKDEGRMEIDQDLIESYTADISREPKADLFKMLEKYPSGVPCFYLIDNKGNIKSFGHTPLFRLAYDKKVKDHLPPEHKADTVIDFTEAIFGNADKFAGRVFFEDTKIVDNPGQCQELSPKILSTPKPTTIQHYLEQESTELADWNDDNTYIRGYKLYWHRKTPKEGDYAWETTEEEINEAKSQYTRIKPIYEKATFSGRIRFENLSDVELGALLFVLDLPTGCAHKIGMGKPLGLGSIKVTPTLAIAKYSNENGEAGRYAKLFANGHWYLPVYKNQGIKVFKDLFAKHMLTELKENKSDYWNTFRMRELRAMLNFDEQRMAQRDWLERTRYQTPKEFECRLSSPNEVLDAAGINYEKQ